MSNQRITFNPDVNAPYGVNFSIYPGSDLEVNFTTYTMFSTPYDFDGWSGSAQMSKSVSIGSTMYAHGTFDFSFISASAGLFKIAMGATNTRALTPGRYYYDILMNSGTRTYKIVEGNIMVQPGISSAP